MSFRNTKPPDPGRRGGLGPSKCRMSRSDPIAPSCIATLDRTTLKPRRPNSLFTACATASDGPNPRCRTSSRAWTRSLDGLPECCPRRCRKRSIQARSSGISDRKRCMMVAECLFEEDFCLGAGCGRISPGHERFRRAQLWARMRLPGYGEHTRLHAHHVGGSSDRGMSLHGDPVAETYPCQVPGLETDPSPAASPAAMKS